MNETIKGLLQNMGVYHSLQSGYRSARSELARQYNRLQYAKYKGSGYTCNFCFSKYSVFVPELPEPAIAGAINSNHVIAGYGENVYCPNCMSKNRERLLLAVLKHRIEINATKILHFSPEANLHRYLVLHASVTSADIAPGFYKLIDPGTSFADATNLQFEDGSFDMVIANHILEHIPDDKKAMSEIFRVIKPGGTAILQVPFSAALTGILEEPWINDPATQERLFGQKDHVRIYSLDGYLERISAVGFINRSITPGELQIYRDFAIQKEEYVFLFQKPG